MNNDKIILQRYLELSNVMIVQEQVNYLELIRFYNLIYDTITRLDLSFSEFIKLIFTIQNMLILLMSISNNSIRALALLIEYSNFIILKRFDT